MPILDFYIIVVSNLIKPFAIILICLLPCIACFGQDDADDEENEHKDGKPTITVKSDSIEGTIKKIVGAVDSNYYLLVKKGLHPNYSIVKYNDKLSKKQAAAIFNSKDPQYKHKRFEKVLLANGRMLLFTTERIKTKDSTVADITYVEPINPQNLKIGKRDTLCKLLHDKKKSVLGRYIITSPDSSKLGLILFQKTSDKHLFRCIVKVYDTKLQLLWEAAKNIHCSKHCINRKDDESFYGSNSNDAESVKAKMDDEGNVFIQSPNPVLMYKMNYNADTVKYYFYTYTNSGKSVKELGINGYKDNTIDMMDFYCRNDSIVFSGVCSKKTELSSLSILKYNFIYVPQGTFVYKYSPAADTVEKLLVNNISVLNRGGTLFQFINAGEEGNIVLMVGAHLLKEKTSLASSTLYSSDKVIAVKRSNTGEISCMADVLTIFYEMYYWVGFYQDGYIHVIFNYYGKTYMATTGPDCEVMDTEEISKDKINTEKFGIGKDLGNGVFLYVQKNKKKKVYSFIKVESE